MEPVHVWTHEEAFRSGKTAYRIKVEMGGNPFKGDLGKAWLEGWRAAASADTSSQRVVNYIEMDDSNDDKRRKPRGKTVHRGPRQRG